MKKLFLSAFLFSYLFSSDEIIDYQIFKSYTSNIDTKEIVSKKEIFFGLKQDYEKAKIDMLNNSYAKDIEYKYKSSGNYLTPTIGTGIGLFGGGGSGLGISLGLGIPIFTSSSKKEETIEYLRVLNIKDKNQKEAKEFVLFITKNENYNRSDVRDILDKENKK